MHVHSIQVRDLFNIFSSKIRLKMVKTLKDRDEYIQDPNGGKISSLTESELFLRPAKGDGLAGGVAGGHLNVDPGLRQDLVDAVALGSDDVAVLRLFHLDRDRGHLALLLRKVAAVKAPAKNLSRGYDTTSEEAATNQPTQCRPIA